MNSNTSTYSRELQNFLFYLTSKGNILTVNIPRPSSICQTIMAQIHRQQNFLKYFRLCDAGFYRFSLWYANLSIRKLEAWVNLTKHVAFSDFPRPLSPLPFFNSEDEFVGQIFFQTAIEENWSEGRIEKNNDLLFSQQSRHSRPSSLCEASSSCFFSATPSAIKTVQNCSKIVDTYICVYGQGKPF